MRLLAILSVAIGLLWSTPILAAATAQAVTGDVQVTPAQGTTSRLAVGQRLDSGTTIKTGTRGIATLVFDDGQKIAVTDNSTFIVTDYKFNPQKPADSSFSGSLLKGAIRAVTGLIGESNKQNVSIKTPTATMGIRGTDFQIFYDPPKLYIQVLDGAVSATNSGGVGIFDAQAQPLGLVPNAHTQARPGSLTEFSANAQAAFRKLQRLPLSPKSKKANPNDPACKDRRTGVEACPPDSTLESATTKDE